MDKLNVDEMFRCFKCDYMVDEPHESECCGKLYCQSCVVELTFTQCKICKKGIKFRKNLFAKKLMQRVELKCRHHCGNKFMYEDMKLHLYRCECRIFKCTIEFCSYVGRKFEIVPHMLENHKIHVLTLMENYEEFLETIENILKNPIDNRPPPIRKSSSDLLQIPDLNYNLPRLRHILDGDENIPYYNNEHREFFIDNRNNLFDLPRQNDRSSNSNNNEEDNNSLDDSLSNYQRSLRRGSGRGFTYNRTTSRTTNMRNSNNYNNNHNRNDNNPSDGYMENRNLLRANNYLSPLNNLYNFNNSNNEFNLNNLNLDTFNALNHFANNLNRSENTASNLEGLNNFNNNNNNHITNYIHNSMSEENDSTVNILNNNNINDETLNSEEDTGNTN